MCQSGGQVHDEPLDIEAEVVINRIDQQADTAVCIGMCELIGA